MKISNVVVPILQTTQVAHASPLTAVNTSSLTHLNATAGQHNHALQIRDTQGLQPISWNKVDPYAQTYVCESDDQCGPHGQCTTIPVPQNETLKLSVCECEDGYVNNPKPSQNGTKPEEVCSYKQLERNKQRTISWAGGLVGADYFTSARGVSTHILVGAFKATPLLLGLAGGAVFGSCSHRSSARSGMIRGGIAGGVLQAAWWLFDGARSSISPNADISFKDGRGVPFHA